ncbi:hypothetical protein GCM10027566_08780 [Arachidicoccus ginsenosidivorans]|jgi:PRTRC genetic system protein C|uniref:PRTRC system protein C n=1 Tax=Arachidicoccus ginsenosidivorans TaxID=496057 RepID=A0A5B8VQY4_9BACT|nr:PRTRC system protein C [Arachidicoccus ginsenosidivorans]QEC73312.1 PRTRC system protein C [Arachidicoccus ginsenosidivorans]
MSIATLLERIFIFKDNGVEISLPDPDSKLSPEAVLNFYSNTYDILVTAKVSSGKINNDKLEYKFESVLGTKG